VGITIVRIFGDDERRYNSVVFFDKVPLMYYDRRFHMSCLNAVASDADMTCQSIDRRRGAKEKKRVVIKSMSSREKLHGGRMEVGNWGENGSRTDKGKMEHF